MGKCKTLGSLKSFLWYAPQLSGASILCSHILSFLRAHHREWMQSDGCQMAGILSFPSFLRAHWLTLESCNCWWLWKPCLLIWQEIFHLWMDTKWQSQPDTKSSQLADASTSQKLILRDDTHHFHTQSIGKNRPHERPWKLVKIRSWHRTCQLWKGDQISVYR